MATRKGVIEFSIFSAVFVLSVTVYLLTKSENVRFLFLIIALVSLILIVILIILHYSSRTKKMVEIIENLTKKTSTASLDILKKEYQFAHSVYLKLSEKNKAKFYPHLIKLREHIGNLLVSLKKVETLLNESSKGSLKLRQNKFEQLKTHFHKLPQGEKDKVQQNIMHLKEQLGRGKI